jgi:transcriptional regulator GlxA family with amidase domain
MKIAFLLYDQMTALDFVGPHEILCRIPRVTALRVATKKGSILSDSGLSLYADYSLEEVAHADILLIPGAGNATSLRDHPQMLSWIQKIHQETKWTTSVCTGSLILGAAGILDGVQATTHWAAFERLQAYGAKPTQLRVVEEGKVMTAAGVSAGIDMGLMLTAKVAGIEFAQAMQLALEYDPQPPFDAGAPHKVPQEMRVALQAKMASFFEAPSR